MKSIICADNITSIYIILKNYTWKKITSLGIKPYIKKNRQNNL